jgi:hypothetical protein
VDLEPLIGKTVARWTGRLYEADLQSGRKDRLWLTSLDDAPLPRADGRWRAAPAMSVSVDEVAEWFSVSADCRIEDRVLQVTSVVGDTVQVCLTQRGPSAFTERHGFWAIDWDGFLGEFQRDEVAELRLTRTDLLATRRAADELTAVLTVEERFLNRPVCHHRGELRYPLPLYPDRCSDVVSFAGAPDVPVSVAELDDWSVVLLHGVFAGRPILVEQLTGRRIAFSTDDRTWADEQALTEMTRPHARYGAGSWWQGWADLGDVTGFREEHVDLLREWRALRGTRR